MCGIAGILMTQGGEVDPVALKAMRDALARRGPDGHGIYTDRSIGLVHTRLAIIDPAGGQQPITDSHGRSIVFNGEIYNYIEIRNALADTYTFTSGSDTETILALYDKYGLDFTDHLRGMYAFALYDPALGRVILARDPFGIKPLYVTQNTTAIAFASEPKALMAAGFASYADMDMAQLREVLHHNFTQGTATVYPSIHRVPPGTMMVIDGGRVVDTRTRSLLSRDGPYDIDDDVAIAQLGGVMDDSVRMHCRSDVGYGVFLSGGVDSSTIMKILADQTMGFDRIKAYTAYFDVPHAADEREYARAVAASCFADCQEVPFGADDFTALLPQIAAYMDDPVADYAILPTWKLAAVAAKEQKVVLCGEGGDELFAGYGRYRPRWWKDWRGVFSANHIKMSRHWSRLQRAQARDIGGYLPNDLLIKLDTCLMAHGLEGRTPFLDAEVARFAFCLPDQLKLREQDGKYIVKEWLNQNLPESQPFRKKQGFTVPVGDWMAADAATLAPLLTNNAFVKELLSRHERGQIAARLATPRGAKECWSLLYLTLWYMGKQQAGVASTISESLAA